MNEIQVCGRLRKPRAAANVYPTHVVIRVDDAANDEFWLDICLTKEQLTELLRQVEQEPGDDEGLDLTKVDTMPLDIATENAAEQLFQ